MQLSRLKRLHVREYWKHEATEFTPWLAQVENLELLGETLDMQLELLSKEKEVGPFRADLLCRDLNTEHLVLVENQLERTDHTHLGQVLTYASGLGAVTVVWIAERFTEEHRSCLEWLNRITHEGYNFFGLELELWSIGECNVAAPKFNIAVQPNEWVKSVSTAAANSVATSELKQSQLEYWTAFRDFLLARGGPVQPTKPYPQHWMSTYPFQRSGLSLGAAVHSRKTHIAVDLYIAKPYGHAFFSYLHDRREEIEAQLGHLQWEANPKKQDRRILGIMGDTEFRAKTDWEVQFSWLAETMERFVATFMPYINAYIPQDPTGEQEVA